MRRVLVHKKVCGLEHIIQNNMAKKKKTFEWWKWDIVKVEVETNKENRLELHFYGNIYPKKNSKRIFWHTILPSENYLEWNKRCRESLKWIEILYNHFPCEILVEQIAHNKVKWDVDNCVTSLLDFMVDVGILQDDNKFEVSKMTVLNKGYVKNCPITKVILSPLSYKPLWVCINHQGENLKECFNLYL